MSHDQNVHTIILAYPRNPSNEEFSHGREEEKGGFKEGSCPTYLPPLGTRLSGGQGADEEV